jgi:hypothetical protein
MDNMLHMHGDGRTMGADDNQLTGAEQKGFGSRQCRQCDGQR